MSTLRQENKEIYWAWKSMKQRTQNPKCRAYRNYGGRGISVCKDWIKFELFCEWALSHGWRKGLDLDRKDNNGDYTPENCHWTTRKRNINNRRNTLKIEIDGIFRSCSEWAEISGIPQGTLKAWCLEKSDEYVSSRIKEALLSGYRERDYTRNHRPRPVRNVDTNASYPSFRAAVRMTGLSSETIWKSLKTGCRTKAGQFVYDISG